MTDPFDIKVNDLNEIPQMERPQKPLMVGDREILFQGLSESQYMQLVHEVTLFRKEETDINRKLKGLDRLYRVLLSLVVNENDRDYVEDAIADGGMDVMFLVKSLREIYDKQAVPEKKVRRGRPAQRK